MRRNLNHCSIVFSSSVVLMAALLVGVPAPLAADALPANALPDPADESLGSAARVEALLARIKHQQAQLRSLEAHFVQTKQSLLLVEPEVSRGTFSYQTPDQARWEFTEPNQTVMIVRDGEMLTWYRDLGTAERVSVGQHSSQIEQYLSATNSIGRLQRYFDLTTAFPTDGRPYRIELTPRYDRIAKRLSSMTIWFDRDRFVPVRLSYVEPDGDVTEFAFEQVEINGDLAPERFALEVPDGVKVRQIGLAGR